MWMTNSDIAGAGNNQTQEYRTRVLCMPNCDLSPGPIVRIWSEINVEIPVKTDLLHLYIELWSMGIVSFLRSNIADNEQSDASQ
jgi:hypothetical protein